MAVLEAGTARAESAARAEIAPGARLKGKVERLESYGVFVFLNQGIQGNSIRRQKTEDRRKGTLRLLRGASG